MKLSAFKQLLSTVEELHFILPNGTPVPAHFHITEIGQISKKFIDCGGIVREELSVSMQLWESIDTWHRLAPSKLISIIELSEQKLGLQDEQISMEYQGQTIESYGLAFDGAAFILTVKTTDCLAPDKCGIPQSAPSVKEKPRCKPGSGCC